MSAYTSVDYVYSKNMADIPNEHHNHCILNQIHYVYITSPLKFMDEIFESLPNLFVYQMIKKWMNAHMIFLISYKNAMYGAKRIN